MARLPFWRNNAVRSWPMRMRRPMLKRQLANELARVRDRLAEVRGWHGWRQHARPAATRVSALIEQLQRMGDTAGTQDVARLIDVESDLAELARFERQYQAATERLSLQGREPRCRRMRASSPDPDAADAAGIAGRDGREIS